MNISAIVEKRLSDQVGALILENTKLTAIIQAIQEENQQLKARIAELEAPKANGVEIDGEALAH